MAVCSLPLLRSCALAFDDCLFFIVFSALVIFINRDLTNIKLFRVRISFFDHWNCLVSKKRANLVWLLFNSFAVEEEISFNSMIVQFLIFGFSSAMFLNNLFYRH